MKVPGFTQIIVKLRSGTVKFSPGLIAKEASFGASSCTASFWASSPHPTIIRPTNIASSRLFMRGRYTIQAWVGKGWFPPLETPTLYNAITQWRATTLVGGPLRGLSHRYLAPNITGHRYALFYRSSEKVKGVTANVSNKHVVTYYDHSSKGLPSGCSSQFSTQYCGSRVG
jgi:hypothetical protein